MHMDKKSSVFKTRKKKINNTSRFWYICFLFMKILKCLFSKTIVNVDQKKGVKVTKVRERIKKK